MYRGCASIEAGVAFASKLDPVRWGQFIGASEVRFVSCVLPRCNNAFYSRTLGSLPALDGRQNARAHIEMLLGLPISAPETPVNISSVYTMIALRSPLIVCTYHSDIWQCLLPWKTAYPQSTRLQLRKCLLAITTRPCWPKSLDSSSYL